MEGQYSRKKFRFITTKPPVQITGRQLTNKATLYSVNGKCHTSLIHKAYGTLYVHFIKIKKS